MSFRNCAGAAVRFAPEPDAPDGPDVPEMSLEDILTAWERDEMSTDAALDLITNFGRDYVARNCHWTPECEAIRVRVERILNITAK